MESACIVQEKRYVCIHVFTLILLIGYVISLYYIFHIGHDFISRTTHL